MTCFCEGGRGWGGGGGGEVGEQRQLPGDDGEGDGEGEDQPYLMHSILLSSCNRSALCTLRSPA